MLVRFSKLLTTAAMTAALCMPVWGQAAQSGQQGAAQDAPKWKDQAEYDLVQAITKETTPQKKLDLINQWKEKYPDTFYKQMRLQFYLLTYQQLANVPQILATAREMLALDPKDVTALYTITSMVPGVNDQSAAALDQGEKAARGLLENLDTMFAKEKKPAQATDEQWAKGRKDTEALAHKTLGWVAMIRKDYATAEKEFVQSLQLNPQAGEVSYFAGQVITSQLVDPKVTDDERIKRTPAALWHYARAAGYDGPGALAPAGRTQVDAYLTKAYNRFHGGGDGLPELKAKAKNEPVPPADLRIVSAKEVAEAKLKEEQAFIEKNPQAALWKNMKDNLVEKGAAYFESDIKGAKIPPKSLRGKVVSSTAKSIVLAMSDDTTPEVTLTFDAPLGGKADPGSTLEFGGVGESFTASPFMLTFTVEKGDVTGLSSAAPARRTAPAKKGATKGKKK